MPLLEVLGFSWTVSWWKGQFYTTGQIIWARGIFLKRIDPFVSQFYKPLIVTGLSSTVFCDCRDSLTRLPRHDWDRPPLTRTRLIFSPCPWKIQEGGKEWREHEAFKNRDLNLTLHRTNYVMTEKFRKATRDQSYELVLRKLCTQVWRGEGVEI